MTETDIDGVINGEFTAQAETDRNGTTYILLNQGGQLVRAYRFASE
jgi:hypothetical protein